MAEGKIVKNQSKGYGYTYSSLADLHKAGIKIPKMRTKATEFGEFVEYYDEATQQWLQGARVVPFERKGMNAAQAYGASLTYARRYTVQMAESVACDDDKGVENSKPIASAPAKKSWQGKNSSTARPSEKQLSYLKRLLVDSGKSNEEAAEITSRCATSAQASQWIEKAKGLADLAKTDNLPDEEEVL